MPECIIFYMSLLVNFNEAPHTTFTAVSYSYTNQINLFLFRSAEIVYLINATRFQIFVSY